MLFQRKAARTGTKAPKGAGGQPCAFGSPHLSQRNNRFRKREAAAYPCFKLIKPGCRGCGDRTVRVRLLYSKDPQNVKRRRNFARTPHPRGPHPCTPHPRGPRLCRLHVCGPHPCIPHVCTPRRTLAHGRPEAQNTLPTRGKMPAEPCAPRRRTSDPRGKRRPAAGAHGPAAKRNASPEYYCCSSLSNVCADMYSLICALSARNTRLSLQGIPCCTLGLRHS